MELIDALDYPNFPHAARVRPALSRLMQGTGGCAPPGQYALAWRDGEDVLLARDPLGCNKLFYGRREDGRLVAASRIRKALDLGILLDDLASCPPGRILRVQRDEAAIAGGEDLSSREADADFDLGTFQERVRRDLDNAFKQLREDYPGAVFALCLSGGMDSTAVAALACEHLERLTAFSFSYLPDDALPLGTGAPPLHRCRGVSEDFCSAAAVADSLGIEFVPVIRPREAIASAVETALRLCQDWRDFNVHCAVVNLFLAQDIRARFPETEVIVMTGDLMNEYVCDYREEMVDGVRYYPQPRLSRKNWRRFLVRGLDAGDREIGVFHAFGLPVRQVFSALAEPYMSVPVSLLERHDAKEILNGPLIPRHARHAIGRTKRRAQVGGNDGGTLGGFHRLGIDQGRLQRIWRDSLPAEARGKHPHDIIEVGRYRTSVCTKDAADGSAVKRINDFVA